MSGFDSPKEIISLLKGDSRQEGVWISFLTTTVAENVIQIEEEGLGDVRCYTYVSDQPRISEFAPIFDLMRR